MAIKAVIFDLDGLLTDTETLHYQSYLSVFGPLGVTITEYDYADHWIRQGKGIDDFITLRKLKLSSDLIREQKIAAYLELLKSELKPMPGAVALLDRLRESKRIALASSAYRVSVDNVLSTLQLGDRFEVVVCGDEVTHKKPHPEIFTTTAARLKVPPDQCVVLEDAEKGILAAKAAGMHCIAVPNRFTHENDFSSASLVVASLDDITLDTIDRLAMKEPE